MIFKSGNAAIQFYMPECVEREEVYQLIEENGGKTSLVNSPQSVFLLPYEQSYVTKQTYAHPIYSYNFVLHSVSLRSLQLLKDYELGCHVIKQSGNNKVAYSEKEDAIIIEYVQMNKGNPNNISFWAMFKREKGSERSADSLRAHWKFLSKNPKETKKSKSVPTFKQMLLQKKKMNSPKEEFDNQDMEIEDKKEDEINCQSQKVLKNWFEGEFEEKFLNLVDACSNKSKSKVSPLDVLDVLARSNGSVAETLKYFEMSWNLQPL